MKARALIAAGMVVATLSFAAACGDDDENDSAPAETTAAATSAAAAETTAAATTEAPATSVAASTEEVASSAEATSEETASEAATSAETEAASSAAAEPPTISGEGRVVVAEFGGAYSKSVDETLVQPFSEATGYEGKVVDTTDRVQKPLAMVKAGKVEWDVLEALGTEAAELDAKGALEKLPADLKTQIDANLNPGTTTDYGVAISSYSYVMACNRKTVDACPTNAADFWDTKGFPGRRTVFKDDWLDNMVMALIADGVSPDQLFPLDIDRALKKWEPLKDEIDVYFTTGDQWAQLLRDEEVDMGFGPDGRTWNLVNDGMDLSISYEGMPYQVDYFVVPKGAPNTQGAFDYLLWYATNPEAQANFAKQQLYGMPNPKAYDFLDEKTAQQLVDYPANKEQTVPVDVAWVYENGAAAAKAWADFLAS